MVHRHVFVSNKKLKLEDNFQLKLIFISRRGAKTFARRKSKSNEDFRKPPCCGGGGRVAGHRPSGMSQCML